MQKRLKKILIKTDKFLKILDLDYLVDKLKIKKVHPILNQIMMIQTDDI